MLDGVARRVMLSMTVSCILLLLLMIAMLAYRARPILEVASLSDLLFSAAWKPMKGQFGLLAYIAGTLWVTGVAVIVAVPVSLLTAIFLAEYAHKRFSSVVCTLVDILAGIPSVVYGVWGMLVIVPLIKDRIAPMFGVESAGFSVLAGGLVLAIMITPLIINVSVEVFRCVPDELREASLSLGATKWQTCKYVVLRKALPGILAANMLGLARAFGETMAVLMVAGNVARLPTSVFSPAYPLPALIANNYGEMMSIPMYDSALLLAALVLLGVVMIFSLVSRFVLMRFEERAR